ncbi:DUF2279 domain-containing protein [Sphingomonas sp.]|uniref:DUF2279 domain-containing protein n=1 Tax=Sphingomonas sp. TaxID=28214 RepID=UPI002DD65B11|nr:DUF2279 domain-containing protein [Sphingomonas sp.]
MRTRIGLGGGAVALALCAVPVAAQDAIESVDKPGAVVIARAAVTQPEPAPREIAVEIAAVPAATMVDQPPSGDIDPAEAAEPTESRLPGDAMNFGRRAKAVKWEIGAIFAIVTAKNLPTVIREPQPFRFVDEGFFGRNTEQAGVDKVAHAWNTYLFTDVLYRQIADKTGGGRGAALTAAALGLGLQTYTEVYDGIHRGSGFSMQDMLMNSMGAGFSVLRHTVPGLREKVDFRLMAVPTYKLIQFGGDKRFENQWFLLALKGAGFKGVRDTPLRFVELHVGYHAKNFALEDRLAGKPLERKPFVGIGLNVTELFLKDRRGSPAAVARGALEYLQPPYVAVHVD